eukprot:CAMPEP_0202457036 /NCGR_PEP_ID=MMETSP1360-20130828/14146_1 /ASSEMBLY_ACC=CAM_ASM_000848 /TAXON_ID=515479 /ORGANISM="Licmophora paradoxa, Strain CCMP2313" /LENGTH=706 /DNA_ID=CAMNT_0049077011 /DNA_START=274 /DNA_END=2392 /DNA_ORIENTATION=+
METFDKDTAPMSMDDEGGYVEETYDIDDITGTYGGDSYTEETSESSIIDVLPVSNNISYEQDLAKEIVLDALAETSPDQILAVHQEEVGTGIEEVDEITKVEDATGSDAQVIEAILAVSQQAVDKVEAKLPEGVAESIPLIPAQDEEDEVEEKITLVDVAGSVTPQPTAAVSASVTARDTPAVTDVTDEDKNVAMMEDEPIEAPSVKKIIKFAIPAVGVWLCSPLLSLIDTSAVGLLSGTAQQAALNPAVAVTDYAALLIAFLYTGATNLVASAQAKDRGVNGKPRTTAAFTTAMQLSGYVGAGLGAILFIFARPLLKALIGNDSISPEVFTAAMKYVRIRGLGMPAAAIIGSAQASCLGMQDIKSPLYVLIAAATINFLGDAIFVGSNNPWIGGAAGAAWATVFSQYSAVWFFMRWLTKRPKKTINLTNAIMELTGGSKDKGGDRREDLKDAIKSMGTEDKTGKSLAMKIASVTSKLRRKSGEEKKRSVPQTRGFLAGKFRGRDLFKLPKKERANEYAPYVLPVTTTQFGRVSSYVAMSHVVASVLGTSAMAAQQVIVSLFYCLTPFADSLSLTAQSFVPLLFEKEKSEQRTKALGDTMKNFFKAGLIASLAMIGAVLSIPLISGLFTSDAGVIALINSVAPLLIGFFGVHGVLLAAEGLLLAQKDLNFLGKMYGVFFFAVPYFMLRVKKAALAGTAGVNLASVW